MKALLLTLPLLLTPGPASAADYVILPNLYASEYCGMRELGVDHAQAVEVAVNESIIRGTPIKVTINGKEYDADVVKANRAAVERCPQFF